ncbi:twin-arginine translocase subunit TatC [Microbacterium sp. gxy059]
MTLIEHLKELRKRLTIAAVGLIVGMIAAFLITDWVIMWLGYPIEQVADKLGDDSIRLQYTTVTGPFNMRMQISFAIGLIISAPVWLWQIWAFIMPGLKKREVWYTVGFMAAAIPLFFGGVAVAIMLLPNIITIMSSFMPDTHVAGQFYEADKYYSFVFKTLTVIGVSFVLPVFLVALDLAQVITGRQVFRAWRWALIISLVIGMFASPPADIVTMVLVAGIMFGLYAAAGIVCLIFDRVRRRRDPDTYVDLDAAS